MSSLMAFAASNHPGGSHFTEIAAFQDVTLGDFDWSTETGLALIRE